MPCAANLSSSLLRIEPSLSSESLMSKRDIAAECRIFAQTLIAESDNRFTRVKAPYVRYPFVVTGGSEERNSAGGGSMITAHGRSQIFSAKTSRTSAGIMTGSENR